MCTVPNASRRLSPWLSLMPGWKRTTPWDSWDFEHESGWRMEVKQLAAAQAWSHRRASSRPRFDVRSRSGYWDRSGRWRSPPGRHADVYVFAWHQEVVKFADQREPMSWQFYIVRERDLPDQKTIALSVIRRLAQSCRTDELHSRLDAVGRRGKEGGASGSATLDGELWEPRMSSTLSIL